MPEHDIISKYSDLLSSKKPYGIYNAIDWDGVRLNDSVNNNNALPIRGSTINMTTSTDGGAGTNIPFIYGNTTSGLVWPPSSIGTNVTICAIMRYTGPAQGTLFHDMTDTSMRNKDGSLFLKCGSVLCEKPGFFNNSPTNWVTTCFKTTAHGDDHPNNVIINGQAFGQHSSGGPLGAIPPPGTTQTNYTGKSQNFLIINGISDPTKNSNFALAYLAIWDQELTQPELMIVSNALQNYLQTGKIGGLKFGKPGVNYNEGETAGGNDDATNISVLDTSIIPDITHHQDFIKQAIADESDRVNKKTQSVDYAISGQKRDIQLNESYRKKYVVYTNIVICIVIALLVYIVFSSINLAYGSFSSFAMNSLSFLLLGICIVYIMYSVNTLYSRDPLNFDELVLPAPIIGSNVKVQDSSTKYIDNYGNCANGECCNIGTTWNPEQAKCEPVGYSFNL